MGGHALKTVRTQRLNAEDYFAVSQRVVEGLQKIFPNCRVGVIPAYKEKQTFGDADILIEKQGLPDDWKDRIVGVYRPQEFATHPNNPVISFDFRNFQIDVISTPAFDMSMGYYGYNDLGNLMGRVASSMGLSLSHEGLRAHATQGTRRLGTVILSRDFHQSIAFLGFDSDRYKKGFNNLEDIFKYVVSNHHFDPWFFQLENRSYKERIRDIKRPTYNKFLTWMNQNQIQPGPLAEECWRMLPKHAPDMAAWLPTLQQSTMFQRALEVFPHAREEWNRLWTSMEYESVFKEKWNGHQLAEWTGLSEKNLGRWMKAFKNQFESDSEFRSWVLSESLETLREKVQQFDPKKWSLEMEKGGMSRPSMISKFPEI